jgi:hypothetical protein
MSKKACCCVNGNSHVFFSGVAVEETCHPLGNFVGLQIENDIRENWRQITVKRPCHNAKKRETVNPQKIQ